MSLGDSAIDAIQFFYMFLLHWNTQDIWIVRSRVKFISLKSVPLKYKKIEMMSRNAEKNESNLLEGLM